MKNDYISVKLDKDDLLALISSRAVNTSLPINLWYIKSGYHSWNMAELCKKNIDDLFTIYRISKWGNLKSLEAV